MQIQIGDTGSAGKSLPGGMQLEVLRDNGESLEVKDPSGTTGTIAKADVLVQEAGTSGTAEPAPATPPGAPDPAQEMQNTTTPEAGPAAAKSPEKTTPTAAYSDINTSLNMALFASDNLWQEDASTVAKRIKFPIESETSSQGSYRSYPKADVRVLGARPYSMALYADNKQPHYLSFVFANQGDFEGLGEMEKKSSNQSAKLVRSFTDAVRDDARTLETALTALLGKPERQQYGTTSTTRESVSRWNWKGHAFLLASPKGEYTALRIVSCETADAQGRATKITDNDLRELLKQRVEHRPNGDVVVKEIPMVNQGPKGYCVPATWERYLRYLEIPADMYVLAMTGKTGYGGGTSLAAIRANVQSYTQQYSRKIDIIDPSLDPKMIGKYIERGLPVMWGCFVDAGIEKRITQGSTERKKTTDWAAYTKSLETVKKEMRGKHFSSHDTGHLRMIIGCNAKTGELAISDSWGDWAAERWLTMEEAVATTQGDLTIIKW